MCIDLRWSSNRQYYLHFHTEIINHRTLLVLSHVGPQYQIIFEIHVKVNGKYFILNCRAFFFEGGGRCRAGRKLHASVLFEYF